MPFADKPSDPLVPARASFIAPETWWYAPPGPFLLESGARLERLQVAYRTWGRLSPAGDNAVVVCHAFTGSADADRWWSKIFGPGRALDPERDYVVCANILGSCYGTTGPASTDPATGRPWLGSSPEITLRDMVRVQAELVRALGVNVPRKKVPFVPTMLNRWLFLFLTVTAVLGLVAWYWPAPLGDPADPTDSAFVPKPEWWVLSLNQLVAIFKGPLTVIGTAVIPGGLALLLMALPFLDRSPERHQARRNKTMVVAAVIAATLFALTVMGYIAHHLVLHQ